MMRLHTRIFAVILSVPAMLFAGAVFAATTTTTPTSPTLVKATYKVYKAGIWIGTIEEQFDREGDSYKIVSETDTAGPLRLFLRDRLTVTSKGTIGADGLKPGSYQFARRNDQKKNISSVFDWDKHQIVSQHSGDSEVFELPAGTQDRLSALYQFMFSIPRTPEVILWMSQGKKVEQYRYRKIGEPALTINNESIATVYYVRDAKPGESKAHLWLGTGKGKYYLPVRIVFEDEHGGSFEQLLVSLHTE